MKKIFSSALIITLLLSSCGAPEEDAGEKKLEIKKVKATEIVARDFTPTIEISGSLAPIKEAMIASESSGVIQEVFVSEGDEVKVDNVLARFRTGDNSAYIQMQNAVIAVNNADRALNLTIAQAKDNENNAKIRLEQAKVGLKNAKKSSISTINLSGSQEDVYASSLELAIMQTENAKKSLEELEENLELEEKTIHENKENLIDSSIILFRSTLEYLDSLVGFSDENRKNNDSFETYFGFYDQAAKINTNNNLRYTWNQFLEIEAREDVTLEEIETMITIIKANIKSVDILLQKSATGATFTTTMIANHKSAIDSYRNSLEQMTQSISGTRQALSNFATSKPQRLRAAELAIQTAETNKKQAEHALEQISNSGDLSSVQTGTAIDNASQEVKAAENALEMTKTQNSLMIQNAKAQKDAAINNLRLAELADQKLSVSSPIKGTVLEKNVTAGDSINMGSPLFFIGDNTTLLLKGDVSVENLAQLKVGTTAAVDIDYFGARKGKLSKIYPTADKVTRRVGIEISIANKNQLIPANIFAKADLELTKEKNKIMISRKNIIAQDPTTVFIINEENKIEKREVKLGNSYDDNVEVLSGLQAGEIIVAEAVLGLLEGDQVEYSLLEDEKEESKKFEDLVGKKGILEITDPANNVDIEDDEVIIAGNILKESEKAVMIKVNKEAVLDYEKGANSFEYTVSLAQENLKLGKNTYVIQVLDSQEGILDFVTLNINKISKDAKAENSKVEEDADLKTDESNNINEDKTDKNSANEEKSTELELGSNDYCQAGKASADKLSLFYPENKSTHAGSQIAFKGEAPENTGFIEINGYNLTTYHKGDRCFIYNAAQKWSNLKPGINNYEIKAFSPEGKLLDTLNISLTWK